MASLVLGIAGSAIGPSLFGAGFSLFGATVTGAEIGGAIGTLLGAELDNLIAPGTHVTRKSPRLSDVNIQASTEGAAVPRVYGRMRVAGQLLWATRFRETVIKSQQSGGGKGGPPVTETEIDYKYSISFAVGLCAGVVTKIGRVWADGNLIDISQFTSRFYPGDETQSFDPLIEEIEGAGNTPAYRGLATIVFEDMDLTAFGNRIPQLNFEIIRSLSANNPDALENRLGGVALIPGAGEFVYATEVVTADDGRGTTTPQNAHNASGVPDYTASLDELAVLAPNFGAVSLVVGWFGDDLRCGETLIKPGVEIAKKDTYPETWSVDGVSRATAHVVSAVNGIPAYGGTPSDQSVVEAIQDLKARGLRVLLNPFLFLDIAGGNTLQDPLIATVILDRDLSTPPPTPSDGDTYLVKATGTGVWTGQDGKLAYAIDGGWRFYAPFEGLSAYVADETKLIIYNGSAWADFVTAVPLENVPMLGINATADATNKLTVAGAAVLFNNIGAGVQAKLNKNASGDTASLLYQTNFSGRAEIGLTGDDNFHFKVSPDGSTFYEALILSRNTGSVLLKHVDVSGGTTIGATHLGRLVRADASGGAFNVTLPTTTDADDWVVVRKKDSGSNRVTLRDNGGNDLAWLSAQHDEAMFAFWDGVWTPVRWNIAPLTQVFTVSGTWTKPPLIKQASVTAIGGGAGGGSGRRGASASARAGGQGGQAGVLNRWGFVGSDFSATETITVGAGGSGGAAQTVDASDGNPGGAGGNSSFGAHLLAFGGAAGAAGSAAAAPATLVITTLGGSNSNAAPATSLSAASGVPTDSGGPATGGNGGSISALNAGFAGAAGANGSIASVSKTNGGGAGAAGANNGVAGASIADVVNQFGGAGGGGGGGNSAGTGGSGGAGGTPGGGGGGGGASLNGNMSGAGGSGARGEVRVTAVF